MHWILVIHLLSISPSDQGQEIKVSTVYNSLEECVTAADDVDSDFSYVISSNNLEGISVAVGCRKVDY